MDLAEYKKLINWLLDYPVKKTQYSRLMPDELQYDVFPGKDFVVGCCDENIEALVAGLSKPNRDQCAHYIGIFKQIKKRRLQMLADERDKNSHEDEPDLSDPFELAIKEALF